MTYSTRPGQTNKKYADAPYAIILVPEGCTYNDMMALRGDSEIGDKINKIIRKLADENDLRGVIDQADFNDEDKLGRGKEMVDRLSKLLAIFDGIDMKSNRAEGDDLLGDAYEYLMRHFATESGKSKGQFYTPAEVSRIMARVLQVPADAPPATTVYDPTCGSGSLLLKVADQTPDGLSLYGQEMDNATWALARMNMFLHGYPTHEIFRGNAEASIRRTLIRQGYIQGIIGLPPNLFYGTGIPACIIVLDKVGAKSRQQIFMVDASRGFIKDGNKNRLRERDIHQIVDVFTKQMIMPGYARLVPMSEIEANDYNLNIPRYIDSSDPEDRHDLQAPAPLL